MPRTMVGCDRIGKSVRTAVERLAQELRPKDIQPAIAERNEGVSGTGNRPPTRYRSEARMFA